jgi:cytochrome c oxidase subunit 4
MRSIKIYTSVYFALLALLALTFIAAHVDLHFFSPIVALTIAALKAILIGWFFMGLGKEKPLPRVASLVGLYWLAVLFALSLSDYLSRWWLALPGRWPLR